MACFTMLPPGAVLGIQLAAKRCQWDNKGHTIKTERATILLAQCRSRDFACGAGNGDLPQACERHYPRARNL